MANINPGWFNVTEIEKIELNDYVKQRQKICFILIKEGEVSK